jgi:starvation-inducible DNA-binding protein
MYNAIFSRYLSLNKLFWYSTKNHFKNWGIFMIHTNIGLSDSVRKQVSEKLTVIISYQFTVYIKTLKFHWNVQGMNFKPLHLFFEEQYEQMLDIVDEVAERIRALGHMAPGTMKEFLQLSKLTEAPGENLNDKGMLQALLHDHEAIIQLVRKEIDATAELGDMGTNNFLCDILEKHEKMAWMLRAFVD